MRTGDDHYGDHTLEGEFKCRAQTQPGKQGQQSDADGDIGQPGGGAIGQVLGAGARALRLAHHVDHLGKIGLVTGLLDLQGKGVLAIDRTADYLIPLVLVHRGRLAGEHRLIERALPLGDDAIGRDLLTRFDQHPIPDLQLGDRHLLGTAIGQPVCLGRQEFDQFLQRPGGAHHRTHFNPVAEQHHVDQGGQLPEEDLALQPEHHRAGVDPGHGNGQGDQGHHPRLAFAQLTEQPLEERPAAIEEDRAGKTKQEIDIAREGKRLLQSKKGLDHRRENKDGQGQCQGHPETPAKIDDHRGVVGLMSPMPGMGFLFMAGMPMGVLAMHGMFVFSVKRVCHVPPPVGQTERVNAH